MIGIEGCILLGGMLLLAFLGVPLVFAIGFSSLITVMIFHPSLPLELLPQYTIGGVDNFALLAIPFFFLVGDIMNSGGLTSRLLLFSNGLVGGLPGGLAHVNVVQSMIFAGISGSIAADIASEGPIIIPMMTKSGYSRGFSAAITAASATIGPIIPPSIPMIVYATIVNVSVGNLFLAGFLPGVFMGVALMLVCYVISIRRRYPKDKFMCLPELLKTGLRAFPAFVVPILIVGGILTGVFTATEAGSVAVLIALFVGFFIYKELTIRRLFEIIRNTVVSTGIVLIILGVSYLFGWIIAHADIATAIGKFLFFISGKSPWKILLTLNIFFLIVGMLMDPLAGMIIFLPVVIPIITSLGINLVHFGLVLVLNLMIGGCTPPVGYSLFITSTISKEKLEVIILECLPFLFILIVVLFICTFWPSMVLFLPKLFGMGKV